MTRRSQYWWLLVASLLLNIPTPSTGQEPTTRPTTAPRVSQDPPLYRDPDPSEGARVVGPLLSPRLPVQLPSTPPPVSSSGPFQASGVPALDPISEPLLGVPPMLPPLPATPLMRMLPDSAFGMTRTTQIRGPNGVLGRFHEWFHDTVFGPGPPRPPVVHKERFIALRALFEGTDESPALFRLPSWLGEPPVVP